MRKSKRQAHWIANVVQLLEMPILMRSVLVYPDLHATWAEYREAVRIVARQIKLEMVERREVEKVAWQLWCFHADGEEPPDPPEWVRFLVSSQA